MSAIKNYGKNRRIRRLQEHDTQLGIGVLEKHFGTLCNEIDKTQDLKQIIQYYRKNKIWFEGEIDFMNRNKTKVASIKPVIFNNFIKRIVTGANIKKLSGKQLLEYKKLRYIYKHEIQRTYWSRFFQKSL